MTDDTSKGPLPWTTPRLELIGTIEDVRNGLPNGDLDDDFASNTAS